MVDERQLPLTPARITKLTISESCDQSYQPNPLGPLSPAFSYKPSKGFRKLVLVNFPASGENTSVVLETMLDCEGGATGKVLHGFDVVHCMRMLSFCPTLLTEMQDFFGKILTPPLCIQPNQAWFWGQEIREVYSLFWKSIDVYSVKGNGLFCSVLVAVVQCAIKMFTQMKLNAFVKRMGLFFLRSCLS